MPSLAQPSPAGALSVVPLGGLAGLCQAQLSESFSSRPTQPCLCARPRPPASLPLNFSGLPEQGWCRQRRATPGQPDGCGNRGIHWPLLHPPALSSHVAPHNIRVRRTVILETVVWVLCW